jgi:hypothetical protein
MILDCAGGARYRSALGVPGVDPTQAAATMASGAIRQAHEGGG